MTTAELRQAARAFAQAVDMAAQGSGDAHERLVLAWKRSLVTLRPETLPPPVRARFLRLHDRICGRHCRAGHRRRGGGRGDGRREAWPLRCGTAMGQPQWPMAPPRSGR